MNEPFVPVLATAPKPRLSTNLVLRQFHHSLTASSDGRQLQAEINRLWWLAVRNYVQSNDPMVLLAALQTVVSLFNPSAMQTEE